MADRRLTSAMWFVLFQVENDHRIPWPGKGTVDALVRRGLVGTGSGGRLVLTPLGRHLVQQALQLVPISEADR